MRKLLHVFSLFIFFFSFMVILSCSKDRINFEFYDTINSKYMLSTIHDNFTKEFGFAPFVVLVETKKNNDLSYKKQIKILENLPAEDLRLIIVTSSSEEKDDSGYHTTITTAKALSGPNIGFRITIFSSKNTVLLRSEEIVGSDKIQSIIQKFNKTG